MSQRRSNNTQNFQSQYSQYDKENRNSQLNRNEIINDVVRYIIYKARDNMPITRSQLMEHVNRSVRFNEISDAVNEILKHTYGLELKSVESNKKGTGTYIVSNLLEPVVDDRVTENKETDPNDAERVLLLLILSHIFMSNNSVTDVSLYKFLNNVGIDVDKKSPIFGDVEEHINKDLVKKLYLKVQVDDKTKKKIFSWGSRSEAEISKMKILQFVSKVYKNKSKDWVTQYEEANEQFED